jgi:XapX domain-containing protein
MTKIALGLLLGLAIGAGCRWFDVPVPSPPRLVGALLVVAMTVGYIATDRLVKTKFTARGAATTKDLCGGPTGTPGSLSRS